MNLGEADRRLWWQAFAGLAILMALWALATPLFASPDEPAHVAKAAAVARGHLLGDLQADTSGGERTVVRVPAGQVSGIPCYAGRPEVTADCQTLSTSSTALVETTTLAGRYPPLYYTLVGPGSLLVQERGGVYPMRLLSILLSSTLLASALLSARRWRNGFGPLGVAVAVTPMVVFLASQVNPSGMEITAAIGTWAALLTLLDDPSRHDPRLLLRLGVAASCLVLCRGLSPLWLAVLVVVACVPTGVGALRTALGRRDVQTCVLAVLGAGLIAVGWLRLANPFALRPNPARSSRPLADAVDQSVALLPARFEQMVGNFGWLDTSPPTWTYVVWVGAISLLVVACIATASRRGVTALLALGVAVVVLPVALEVSQDKALGMIWQGRYTLPIAVGIPLLAARLITPDLTSPVTRFARRLVPATVALLMTVQFVAFVWNLKRYTVGTGNGLGLTGSVAWSPPVPPLLLVVAAVLVLAWLGLVLTRAVRADESAADVLPTPEPAPEPATS